MTISAYHWFQSTFRLKKDYSRKYVFRYNLGLKETVNYDLHYR